MKRNIKEEVIEILYQTSDKNISILFESFKIPLSKINIYNSKQKILNQLKKTENAINYRKLHSYLKQKQRGSFLLNNENNYKLYISNLTNDYARAILLQKELEKYSIDSYVPRIGNTSNNIDNNIIALNNCNSFLAFNNKNYNLSYKTSQEIGYAYGKRIKVFSLEVNKNTKGLLKKSNNIKSFKVEDIAEELFNNLLNDLNSRKSIIDSIIFQFTNSKTFQETRNNFALLKKNNYWQKNQLDSLVEASKKNEQVGSSTICINGEFDLFIKNQTKLI